MRDEETDLLSVARELGRMRVSDGYSDGDLSRLLSQMDAHVVSFEKGETVVREGEMATRVGVILEGAVHVVIRGEDDRDVLLRMLSAGSFVGLTSLIAPQTAIPMTFVAFTGCTILGLSVDKLLAWRKDPASERFFVSLERQVSEMMLELVRKCAILSQTRIEDRVLTFLRQRCAARGMRTVVVPGKESDLANYLGVHAVALSRVLSKMRADGVIDYRRNVMTLKA